MLVAHSNAGLFIPVITAALPGQVRGCIFVDAALPPAAGAAPVAPPELLALLRDKASGGLLPRWTDWWDEEEVAPLFPDQQTRQAVTEEQPRLPLSLRGVGPGARGLGCPAVCLPAVRSAL